MVMHGRWVEERWRKALAAPFIHVVFGARQTGKSTLLGKLLPDPALRIDLSRPAERAEYLRDPDLLVRRCLAMPRSRKPAVVLVDEAQNVPAVFDAVQHLFDGDKRRWRFVLCGSSARKLRITGANLLPGRSIIHRLYPLTLAERPAPRTGESLVLPFTPLATARRPFKPASLEDRLVFGELPGMAIAPGALRSDLLRTYALVYLEEELRREALVKDWPAFARFLQLAAAEAGRMINYAGIAREAGVSLPTVKTYYQLLEDMFLGFRVQAYSGSPRKSLLSTERFFFFDLGVRNAAAELPLSADLARADPGPLFEQWVTIELWKRLQYLGNGHLRYLRTKAGAEVDLIIERGGKLVPIEVKWTDRPNSTDARHIRQFLKEHPKQAQEGYIVCRCNAPQAILPRITAIPWWML
jgi:predicted AAA+ superfamily ATPase